MRLFKMPLKRWIKGAAGRMGLHIDSDASLPTGVDWLRDVRRSGLVGMAPLCFDVGANVGQTVRELKRSWPAAVVHAFEPFSQPRADLVLVADRMTDVTVVGMALGAEPGSARVQPREMSVLNSLLPSTAPPSGDPSELIRIETVDRYCGAQGIDSIEVFKTDTEGYDLDVLRGADQMLGAQRIAFVHVEVTFFPGNDRNTAFNPVFELLTINHRYRFLGLYDTHPLHHFNEPNLFCNALFVARERCAQRAPNVLG